MSQNYNQWPPKCVCFIFLCPLQPLKKINLAISTHNKRMCTWAVYFPTLLCSRIWFNYVSPFKRHKDAYASIKSKKPQPKGCVSLQDRAQDAYQFSAARLPTVVYGSLSDCSGTLHIHGGTNELSKLATYHNDMKTFRQISPLPSWFCPSWRQAKWDIRFKRILRRTFGRNALRTKKKFIDCFFSSQAHWTCLLWYSLHTFTDLFNRCGSASSREFKPAISGGTLSRLHIFY